VALLDNTHQNVPITIALVAGEASGDTLGAGLIEALKLKFPQAQFVGIGGPKMIQQGLKSWYPMETLSVMGITEVLKHLPELLKLRKRLIQRLLALKPNVFIGIDAPDFNFKIERTLKQNQIKTVHYVGPSVWAWREKRLVKIKKSVDGVLVLFPFETPYYDKYKIPVQFVGHPLANQVNPNLDKQTARQALPLSYKEVSGIFIGILPGSRMSEIKTMMPVYLEAMIKLRHIYPNSHFIVPCIHQKAYNFIEALVKQKQLQSYVSLIHQQAQTVIAASDVVLVTSGTATLEVALMERPMVIAIKLQAFSFWLMSKLATTQWVGLPNILAQDTVVTELIQEDATVDKIVLNLGKLIMDEKAVQKQLAVFKAQAKILKQDASRLAANAVIKWANLPHE